MPPFGYRASCGISLELTALEESFSAGESSHEIVCLERTDVAGTRLNSRDVEKMDRRYHI